MPTARDMPTAELQKWFDTVRGKELSNNTWPAEELPSWKFVPHTINLDTHSISGDDICTDRGKTFVYEGASFYIRDTDEWEVIKTEKKYLIFNRKEERDGR